MQFSTVAIFAAAVSATANSTVTDKHSTVVTVTSCGPEVTDCPLDHNKTTVSTFKGAANKQYAAGAVALAAGALLAL